MYKHFVIVSLNGEFFTPPTQEEIKMINYPNIIRIEQIHDWHIGSFVSITINARITEFRGYIFPLLKIPETVYNDFENNGALFHDGVKRLKWDGFFDTDGGMALRAYLHGLIDTQEGDKIPLGVQHIMIDTTYDVYAQTKQSVDYINGDLLKNRMGFTHKDFVEVGYVVDTYEIGQ